MIQKNVKNKQKYLQNKFYRNSIYLLQPERLFLQISVVPVTKFPVFSVILSNHVNWIGEIKANFTI